MEQDIGVEPMTYTLATCRSTTELILQILVLLPGFEPGTLSNLETMPGISRVFYH
jgi:hypothetical protein